MTLPAIKELDYPVNGFGLNRAFPERYPYLLESTAKGQSDNTRFDILFAFPGETLRWDKLCQGEEDFLSQLNLRWQQASCGQRCPEDIPFAGGWFVYLGYEIAAEIEHRLKLPLPTSLLPHAFATRISVALINDHQLEKSYLVTEVGTEIPLSQVAQDLRAVKSEAYVAAEVNIEIMTEDESQLYLDNVARIKNYIYEGDIFQVNLSRQWSGKGKDKDIVNNLYAKLRQTNPAPFSGIMKMGKHSVLSSSPERLIKVKHRTVDTRPIAGTRARGASQRDDERLGTELLGNLKERAEHLMLLDLERNDLGRVCQPGSVKVTELMTVEHYAHVQHIVSNITGELRDDIKPGDVLRAVFPGGTITGCPKERCMAIIAELEKVGRGAYTGSMGYLNHDGSMDMNILIRTITVDDDSFYFRAGAGIVADSDAEHELQETRIKAEGMLRAFQ